jgi:hypothetical protein
VRRVCVGRLEHVGRAELEREVRGVQSGEEKQEEQMWMHEQIRVTIVLVWRRRMRRVEMRRVNGENK